VSKRDRERGIYIYIEREREEERKTERENVNACALFNKIVCLHLRRVTLKQTHHPIFPHNKCSCLHNISLRVRGVIYEREREQVML